MRTSTWAYPWDIADLGVDRVVGTLAESGVSSVSVAINYHAISTFSVVNEQNPVFYTTRGGVYFPTRMHRYSGITPPDTVEDKVAAVHEALRDRTASEGIELWAWVIGRFQPWVVESYPNTGIVDALGGKPRAQPCASNSSYENFLLELIDDYVSQFQPDRVQLESPGYSAFAAGWVRERILHPISEPVSLALGLCFCPSCLARLEASDHDGARIRDDVESYIRMVLPKSTPDETDIPWLPEIVAMRRRAMRSLLERFSSAVAKYGALFDCEGALPWNPPSGLNTLDVMDVCDGIVLPNPSHFPDEAAEVLAQLTESKRGTDLIVTLEGGDYLPASPSGRVEIISEITAAEPDIVAIYNYGLLSNSAFRDIAQTVSAA